VVVGLRDAATNSQEKEEKKHVGKVFVVQRQRNEAREKF